MTLPKFNFNSKSNYVYLIPLSIYIVKALEILFRIIQELVNSIGFQFPQNIQFILPPNEVTGSWFVSDFIEWFGVLYGILLPLILVRAWEQFDDIDREFDREADAVKILYEDTLLLREENTSIGNEIVSSLREYTQHVIRNYKKESDNKTSKERRDGDQILNKIRKQYKFLIHLDGKNKKESDPLIVELIHRLNDVIDIRGDRIGLSNQRLFETLRIVALATSIIFVLPFYFVSFTIPTGLLDDALIICVTLLVIFIYMIIEDLDEPFDDGTWKVDTVSWQQILEDSDANESSLS
jgi:hypothetical protein